MPKKRKIDEISGGAATDFRILTKRRHVGVAELIDYLAS